MPAAVAYGPAVLEAARELVALKGDYYAAVKASGEAARADRLTSAEIAAVLAAGNAVDDACEAFRSCYFPRAGRVVCALGAVYVASPTGRRTQLVYEET